MSSSRPSEAFSERSPRTGPDSARLEAARSRQLLYGALREWFGAHGYLEVETPCLMAAPSMEPNLTAFETSFVPESGGREATLYLHSSPEYAMKRLLAAGSGPIFQIARVFRNGEIARQHNPEFTMLELYRPEADWLRTMEELEAALAHAEAAVAPDGPERFRRRPFERLTVRDAMLRETGIDWVDCLEGARLREAALAAGVHVGEARTFEEVFFHIFLERVEGSLGIERPTYLTEYPASMAALARLKPSDPRVAERFELYEGGVELANGFSELTDPVEQRRRFAAEQAERAALGRPVYPIDEPFLEALGRMPPSGGVAVGLDRILMRMLGRSTIEDVLLFPASELLC